MNNNYIGERLKRLRKSCGYTQTQIAEIIGVDRTTYSCYERGITIPDAQYCYTLSKIYNIKVSDLLDEESKAFSDYAKNYGHLPEQLRVRDTTGEDIRKIPELTKTERRIIALIRSLTEKQFERAMQMLDDIKRT